MKKLILISFALVLTLGACDLSSLNTNKKEPASVPAGPLFANAQYEYGNFIHSMDQNVNIFELWVQHYVETTYVEESDYNITDRAIAGTVWGTFYENILNNLKQAKANVRQESAATPTEQAVKQNKIATINVMNVLAYSELLNIFGNIPFTKALDRNNPSPSYDDAKTVYSAIMDTLNTAIGNLNASASTFDSDLYYGGNTGEWIKFANSLKMRLGMTLADVEPSQARQAVVSASPNAFQSNNDNAMIKFTTTYPHTSPIYNALVYSGRHDYLPSTVFMNTLNSLNDPRRYRWFTQHNGQFVGADIGQAYQDFSHTSALVKQIDLPGMIMGYPEVEFIRAEARARGWKVGGTIAGHYNNAIRANMQRWGVPQDSINAYMSQPSVVYATADGPWRKKIGIQKWIALFQEPLQAYTEVRRLDYPELIAPDKGVARRIGQLPSRFTYPISEQNRNTANYNQAAQAIGGDKLTTKLFWDTMGIY
ncbi:MAG TPA: SusD/RagB family nutrient-binding outer membrane lipoprotein [Balneolaceae bacterium]|nr:SusD/RagB family nutrient-binding outer membrane lipoprotein [Balneolaceae bacterium]